MVGGREKAVGGRGRARKLTSTRGCRMPGTRGFLPRKGHRARSLCAGEARLRASHAPFPLLSLFPSSLFAAAAPPRCLSLSPARVCAPSRLQDPSRPSRFPFPSPQSLCSGVMRCVPAGSSETPSVLQATLLCAIRPLHVPTDVPFAFPGPLVHPQARSCVSRPVRASPGPFVHLYARLCVPTRVRAILRASERPYAALSIYRLVRAFSGPFRLLSRIL